MVRWMPDFTVIDGGGEPHDFEADLVRRAFARLVISIFRALANGDDPECRIHDALVSISQHSGTARMPLVSILDDVIPSLNEELFVTDRPALFEPEMLGIVRDSLRIAAETIAPDQAARTRRSSRLSDLQSSIERYMIAREIFSRTNSGGSYLASFAERHVGKLGRKKPRPKPRGSQADDSDIKL
jgi:hypothetical protein